MAITQERMIAVITAGLNFRDAYAHIVNKMRVLDNILRDPNLDLEHFKAEFTALLMEASIPFPTVIRDTTMLQTQHMHFQRFAKVNRNHREHMRRKRLLKGIIPRDQSQSLDTILASIPDDTQHNSYLYPENPNPYPNTKKINPPLTPDFQTIPASGTPSDPPPLPPGVPPIPPDTDEDAQLEWYEKYGKYL